MATDNSTPKALNPLVPDLLNECQTYLASVRACVPAGSHLWFFADVAHQHVSRAIKEVDAMKGVQA